MTVETGKTEEEVHTEAAKVIDSDVQGKPAQTLAEADRLEKEEAQEKMLQPKEEHVSKKEHENMLKSMQKRIDKLTAKSKHTEELLSRVEKNQSEASSESEANDEVKYEEIAMKRAKYDEEMFEIEKKMRLADMDVDEKDFKKLVKEKNKIITLQKRLDDDYWKLERNRENKQTEQKGQKNLQIWGDSVRLMMDRFEELQTEDGNLNTNSRLYKEAVALMESNAKKPRWATFTKGINPKYDHENGFELAIYQALNVVESNGQKSSVGKSVRESVDVNQKAQVTTGGNTGNSMSSDESLSNRKIEGLIENARGGKAGLSTVAAIRALKKAGRFYSPPPK